MAMFSHRLRRALVAATSNFHRTLSPSPISLAAGSNFTSVSAGLQRSVLGRATDVARAPVRLFSTRQYKLYKEGDEITEDTVLFEGCDYNHWLFTMDFPKDNPPSPEEMVATYEQTCARGLGISLEEAKKRIYACSTTTYQGFQAIMTEAESEKFKDIPGVVFILPDSYIDPQNKEYGGDKYENGVITHRPPPVQYGRTRPRDRNNRFDRQGGPPPQNFQRNTQYNQQQPPMEGSGRFSSPPQQNYRMPEQGPGQGQSQMPPFQPGYNQGQGSTVPPPYQGGYNQGQGAPVPPYQTGFNQSQGSPVPPYQASYNQGQRTPNNYGQGGSGNYNQGPPRNYSPQNTGNYGPPAHGTGYPGQGPNQAFPQTEQRTAAGDWNNNNPASQPGSDQFPQGRRY